ncbi:hypothetical protein GLU60_01155 [Nanohaloarchaea archaeon H01]|nr:hypothetical protein [Nanohaloarchaea archaeon H01]
MKEEKLKELLDPEEVLSIAWGLIGAWTGSNIASNYMLSDNIAVFLIATLFLLSYIIADEFIKRSRC